MTSIPATCTVDDLGGMTYEVCVSGALGYSDCRRTYTLKATSEDAAAREGLRQFVEEMECLLDVEMKDN